MTKNIIKALQIILLWPISLLSQIYTDAMITAGGLNDASVLLEAWARPLGSGIGSGMCNGWYSTARIHKFPGGSISLMLSAPTVPQGDKTFDVAKLNFSNYRLSSGQSSTISQTIMGENIAGPELVTLGDDPSIPGLDSNLVLSRFKTPGGLGRAPIVPGLQLALGLPRNTEIILRYFPYPEAPGAFTNSLWGLGFKHDLKQWIPALKSRLLDVSILAAFSSFSVKTPIEISVDPAYSIISGSSDFTDQSFFYGVKAFTTQLTASREFLFFTPYFSLGYNHIDSRLKLSGNYPIYQEIIRTGADAGKSIYQTINNPLDINFKANNALRSSVGFRVRFIKVCTFFMEYTLSRYRVLTFGLGLTYR